MRREIKFRAILEFEDGFQIMINPVTVYPEMVGFSYDQISDLLKDTKYTLHDDGIYWDDEDHFDKMYGLLEGEDWFWAEDVEPMQYIELKDKDGEDLDWWEGDILENHAARWLIIFEDGCFCVEMLGRFLIDDFFKKTGYTTEIPESQNHIALRALLGGKKVGNKFENHELLNK